MQDPSRPDLPPGEVLAEWGAALDRMHDTLASLRATLGTPELADVPLETTEPSVPLPAALEPRARDMLDETRALEAALFAEFRSIQETLAANRREATTESDRVAHFFDDHL